MGAIAPINSEKYPIAPINLAKNLVAVMHFDNFLSKRLSSQPAECWQSISAKYLVFLTKKKVYVIVSS